MTLTSCFTVRRDSPERHVTEVCVAFVNWPRCRVESGPKATAIFYVFGQMVTQKAGNRKGSTWKLSLKTEVVVTLYLGSVCGLFTRFAAPHNARSRRIDHIGQVQGLIAKDEHYYESVVQM